MKINLTLMCCVSLFAVCITGCMGSGAVPLPISGRVVLEGGASPTQGEIVFTSDDFTERAAINVDGTFEVKIPKGNYRVIFLGTTIQEYASNAPPTYLVPKKYTDLATTDLTLEVLAANQEVTVQIPTAAGD